VTGRHRGVGRARWFPRARHQLTHLSPLTVGDLQRRARREQPTVPVEPVLIGVRTCVLPFYGVLADGPKMGALVAAADSGLLTVPALVDDDPTGPIAD
jgi:hypothetical protein